MKKAINNHLSFRLIICPVYKKHPFMQYLNISASSINYKDKVTLEYVLFVYKSPIKGELLLREIMEIYKIFKI